MKKHIHSFQIVLSSKSGVAIMIVLSAVTILTAILADFTFETKLNKIKTYNSQDRIQARLNAEAGLTMALARLKLYKEGFNTLQKNKEASAQVGQSTLNLIWSTPFIYPIPKSDKMSIIQKSLIEDFEKNSLIQGEIKLEIQNASNLMNINTLRIASIVRKKEVKTSTEENSKDEEVDNDFTLESQLGQMFKQLIEKKRETDDDFNNRYADKDPRELVSAIKHYISEEDSYEDPYVQSLRANYATSEQIIKHAPLSSMSEIYLIDGYDDTLVELLTSDLTAHGSVVIDLNKITNKTLKLLIPTIDEEQIKAFFAYRDDPTNPKTFNSLADFKKYIVNIGKIMGESAFDERMKKFEIAGIKFGVAGSLFKVISTGAFNQASYNLTAYVTLPAKPVKPEAKNDKTKKSNETKSSDQASENETTEEEKTKEEKKETPIELLEPRVVEILAN